ncbi:hypothetical protein N0V84_009907 [Fusarium piperis]|uniref:Uncharacterized protein n=1 Tax=Fusarium piperis TaxID=1435070 RepID=A0A9W8W5G4_9HYPO|nr:hypothetical protein N0V84_009907 [Fusarium piperis]
MSAPPGVPSGNGCRCNSAPVEEAAEFSILHEQRTLQLLLDSVRRLEARVADLSLRLPAPLELDEDEVLDIRYLLRLESDDELVKIRGLHGILEELHKLGDPFTHIQSIRHIPKPSGQSLGPDGQRMSERLSSLVMMVDSHEAEKEIRAQSSCISESVGFSANCYVLRRRYQVHVEGFEKDQSRGDFSDWTTFFKHHTGQSNIQVRVRFNRFLIETTCLDTALLICRTSVKIEDATFKAIDKRSQREHQKASYHRKMGTFWSRWVNNQNPSSASNKQNNPRTTDTIDQEPQKRQKVSPTSDTTPTSTASCAANTSNSTVTPGPTIAPDSNNKPPNKAPVSITPSSNTAKQQTAPKKRGRPPKSKTECNDPRQTSILQFQIPVTASATPASKLVANEPLSSTPETLEDVSMVDTELAASQESAMAQSTIDTDTDMTNAMISDSRVDAESQVQVSASDSDTTNSEKKTRKGKKGTGKKATLAGNGGQERADGGGATKRHEETAAGETLKAHAQVPKPGSSKKKANTHSWKYYNKNKINAKKKKNGEMKDKGDTEAQGLARGQNSKEGR